MLIKKSGDIRYSEITPKSVYMNRRKFLAGVAAATGAATLGARSVSEWLEPAHVLADDTKLGPLVKSPYSTDEMQTPAKDATHYNNYYEFGTGKGDPASNSKNFVTIPWTVSVEGEIKKPRKFSMDEIMKLAPLEERIYRHRCVEAWSIVVPWIGYSFNVLANLVEPTAKAKYVAFQSYYDVKQMPEGPRAGIELPYVEGLRLDEAMNPLTLLTIGMYGETLPNQDGAPVRMVIPWKYGFKSIKSLVKIRFVKDEPPTTWKIANPREYGFYSNVNPTVDHPRWSQAHEHRLKAGLGLFDRPIPTQMFNGYGDQVASLYTGMDLRKYY
jgi:sulfoxide reductase catalytic subunit YedY